jgi:hypothetical protein
MPSPICTQSQDDIAVLNKALGIDGNLEGNWAPVEDFWTMTMLLLVHAFTDAMHGIIETCTSYYGPSKLYAS